MSHRPFAIPRVTLAAATSVIMLMTGCGQADQGPPAAEPVMIAGTDDLPSLPRKTFAQFDRNGKLARTDLPIVRHTDDEWRRLLQSDRFHVLREEGTERAFTGALLKNKQPGVYTCAGCALPLFDSKTKFESGTGWPSFFDPIAEENITRKSDYKLLLERTEICCARCEGHLGHQFDDGPPPTGQRYCMNSLALAFTPADKVAMLADTAAPPPDIRNAVFAGGCFWCVEAVFEELEGVQEAISGYCGGSSKDANYKAIGTGLTKHAEAVQIIYDANKIDYADLLRVHFATHDPTQLNRQGADVGPQYRSTIFFANEDERALAQACIDDLTDAGTFDRPIVTTLEPLTTFYPAESYHQNYVCENPNQGYVRAVAMPKVEKVRKQFADRLKKKQP